MLWDEVLKHPAVRRAVAVGEERVGRAVVKLLASEGLGEGLRTIAAGAAQARSTLERGVSQALHAASLPSRDDVAALKRRIDELEAVIDGLADRLGRGPAGARDEGGEGGE